jgi:hypothetical protein
METYRNFIIETEFIYSSGRIDGWFKHKDDDTGRLFHSYTIDGVKERIDELIAENPKLEEA